VQLFCAIGAMIRAICWGYIHITVLWIELKVG